MPVKRVHCTYGNPNRDKFRLFSLDECLACANSGKNECHLTAPMIRAVHAGWKDSEERNPYSASSVSQCPRRVILERKLEFGADPAKETAAMRGTLFHDMLEKFASDKEIAEKRLEVEFHGVVITGKFDFYTNGVLYDYKTTENIPPYKYPYYNHRLQINIYRWLLEQKSMKVDKMIIQYVSMGGFKKCEALPLDNEVIEGTITTYIDQVKPALEFDEEKEFGFWTEHLPPILPWEDIRCSWCPVRSYCYDIAFREAKNG